MWLKAATSCSVSDINGPLPNTSPAMSPMPMTLMLSFCTSMPRSRKCRCTADPGALGGNPHALVVVAGGAARGEGVAKPETVLGGDAVGDVGEGRRALVRGDHQVGIVLVVADHVGRRHHFAFLEVVGDVEQAGNEDPVAGDRLGLDLVAATAKRQAARDEAALGADRHDHRVLHLLGLDRAEHLGAEVSSRSDQRKPPASHLAAAQVHALDARRIDEDLVLRAPAWAAPGWPSG